CRAIDLDLDQLKPCNPAFAREAFEREYLRVQIRRFSGNISRTAAFIGMERSALHRKLKALGLTDPGEATEEPVSGARGSAARD
ncbi:MAG: helix-turn-helix domain-containing protein, partial [Thermaurantiacus tibetensis]